MSRILFALLLSAVIIGCSSAQKSGSVFSGNNALSEDGSGNRFYLTITYPAQKPINYTLPEEKIFTLDIEESDWSCRVSATVVEDEQVYKRIDCKAGNHSIAMTKTCLRGTEKSEYSNSLNICSSPFELTDGFKNSSGSVLIHLYCGK